MPARRRTGTRGLWPLGLALLSTLLLLAHGASGDGEATAHHGGHGHHGEHAHHAEHAHHGQPTPATGSSDVDAGEVVDASLAQPADESGCSSAAALGPLPRGPAKDTACSSGMHHSRLATFEERAGPPPDECGRGAPRLTQLCVLLV